MKEVRFFVVLSILDGDPKSFEMSQTHYISYPFRASFQHENLIPGILKEIRPKSINRFGIQENEDALGIRHGPCISLPTKPSTLKTNARDTIIKKLFPMKCEP